MIINKSIFQDYHLENDVKCFLYICFLFHNKKITDAKYKGMLSSLRKGTLNTFKNNYHCKINDRWYNDESMVNILDDVCNHLYLEPIDFESLLKYTNDLLNKNKNYCIEHIFYSIIKPIIQCYYDSNYMFKYLGLEKEFKSFDYEEDYSTFGYCCEDCDGDFEEFKRGKYEYYVLENRKKFINTYFNDYLKSKMSHLYNNPEFKVF